jgi:hypothetical protein
MTAQNNTTFEQAVASILATNLELRESVEELLMECIGDIRHTMRWGSPSAKAAIQKMVVGVMLKAVGNSRSDDSDTEQRRIYQALRTDLQGQLLGGQQPSMPASDATLDRSTGTIPSPAISA